MVAAAGLASQYHLAPILLICLAAESCALSVGILTYPARVTYLVLLGLREFLFKFLRHVIRPIWLLVGRPFVEALLVFARNAKGVLSFVFR